MPYKLNGTYYTLSEIADNLGVQPSTLSQYITRNGYKKVNIGGKRGGICLVHEDEVARIKMDKPSRRKKSYSLEQAAEKLGCSIYDLILKVPSLKKISCKEEAWRISVSDVKIIAAMKDSKKGINWKKVTAVLSALHGEDEDTGEQANS